MGCGCTKANVPAAGNGITASSKRGDVRSHYRIGPVLGSGSFGQVRACVKRTTSETFAVKIMSKEVPKEKRHGTNNVDFALMFRNEVSILDSLDHPHVIKIHEFFEDKHFLYAIMDKCEGGELFSQIIRKRRFSERDAAQLTKQMLSAISYIHSEGIIHRDVKAENFLFDKRSPNAKLILIDFGMSARVTDHEKPLKQLCGSPHYVAPELIRRCYSFKVDLWALGVVVFLMLYGKYPFEGADQRAIVQAILNAQPDYNCRPTPPSQLAIDFMSQLLMKDPEHRLGPEEAMQHPWIKKYTQDDDSGVGYEEAVGTSPYATAT